MAFQALCSEIFATPPLLEGLHVLAACAGMLSHLSIFIRHEWHLTAPALVWGYSSLCVIVFVLIHETSCSTSFVNSLKYTAMLATSYSIGLFTSVIVYRQYFHRLRHFQGPCAASVTKLWHVWKCRSSKNYELMEDLRRRYGPIIRTGPEELTVIDPSIISLLDGPANKCEKANWYDFLLPEVAVNTTRSKKEHDFRRKIWDQGLSTKNLNAYEQRIIDHTNTLISQFHQISNEGKAIIVTDWFYWYAFDVIGDVAFSKSFDMLRDKKWHFAVILLRRAMSLLGPFSPVPWLAQIAFHFLSRMFLIRDWFKMMRWCKQVMEERIKNNTGQLDVAQTLIEYSLKKGSLETDRVWLNGDAIAILIAGSDTVASTLVFAMYELARDQARQELLFLELEGVDLYNRAILQQCDYLNAIIQETLRLHPAVPTGGYRVTGTQGVTMNNTYIPGNVTIVAPRYSLGRLDTCYERANEWIPERWTTKKTMVKDARAFSPFSQGRYNCVGKSLAMVEMRLLIAILVKKFRISFTGTDEGQRLFADLKDQFTAAPGKLELRFHVRD
ncbi:cytochrome P450 [Astrocystis sublimbata]|nr:cytochrome P450 [Astrocystis sublimbata]